MCVFLSLCHYAGDDIGSGGVEPSPRIDIDMADLRCIHFRAVSATAAAAAVVKGNDDGAAESHHPQVDDIESDGSAGRVTLINSATTLGQAVQVDIRLTLG